MKCQTIQALHVFKAAATVDPGAVPVAQSPAVADAEQPADSLGFDEVVERLRVVVDRLEQGQLSLEEALRAYEQGVGLARRGHALLDEVERRVEVLVKGAEGDDAIEPLDGAGEGGE